jgi:hypothetical protein
MWMTGMRRFGERREWGISSCHRKPGFPSRFDLDLTLVPSLKIPTADADRGLGTGKLGGGAIFVIGKEFTETQKLHFNVGYTFMGNAPDAPLKDVLFIGLAGEIFIPGLAEERLQFVSSPKSSVRPKKKWAAVAISRPGWGCAMPRSRTSCWMLPLGGALPLTRKWSFSPLSASPGLLMPPGNAAIDKPLKEERDASSESLVSRVE